MGLGFFDAAEIGFGETDDGVGVCQISIKHERPFVLGNGQSRAVRMNVDEAQPRMG